MRRRLSSWFGRAGVRSTVAAAAGFGAAAFMAWRFGLRRPLADWFVFDLLKLWLWNVVFVAACSSGGAAVVVHLVPARDRTRLETLALSFAVGVVIFVLGMFLGGFAHMWGHAFAVLWPATLLAAGAPSAVAAWRETGSAADTRRLRAPALVASVLGVLLVGVLYLGVMTPAAINYDASWMHMSIAEDYARSGHVVPFPGDQVKNVPHLASVVMTWSFLVPGLDLPQLRWMMALHTEFAILVMTLVGVAALARWLAEREVPALWTAFFLFPGIFVYDSNLGGAADHVSASFAAPLFLAMGFALRRLDRRAAVLLGLVAGGAFLTKIQAVYVLVPLSVWAVVRVARLVLAAWRGAASPAPEASSSPRAVARAAGVAGAIAAGVALVVISPYLLTNLFYYRNPIYPLAQDVFKSSRPTIPDAAEMVRVIIADWTHFPPAALGERLQNALTVAFTFSFLPHYSLVGDLPVFGCLFTMSLPFLLVIPRGGRLRVGAAVVLGAVVVWAMMYLVDRNLQTFLPVIVAVTAAILVRTWELGRLARLGVVAPVALQLLWAVPVYFTGSDRMIDALSLLRGAFDGRAREILRSYRASYVEVGESLPKEAVVLLHNAHSMLGINRHVFLDWTGFQTVVDYRAVSTPRELHERLRALGVTHVVWNHNEDGLLQGEVVFDIYADRYATERRTFADQEVFAVPAAPPPEEPPFRVLTVGLPVYGDGLYAIDALYNNRLYPPDMQRQGRPLETAPWPISLLDKADVVVFNRDAVIDGPTNERLRELHEIPCGRRFRIFARPTRARP